MMAFQKGSQIGVVLSVVLKHAQSGLANPDSPVGFANPTRAFAEY